MIAPIQLFGLGLQGKSPNVTAQRRINLYPEISFEADKTRVAYYQTPGSILFGSLGASPARGLHVVGAGDSLYAVAYSTFYSIDAGGAVTAKGVLGSTAGNVSMADDGTRVLIVDGVGGYYYDIQTDTFTTTADADFPTGTTSCAFLAGRFVAVTPDSNQFQWGDLYADTWPALNFAQAEASPDNLVAVFANAGQLMLMGQLTTEWWAPSADPALPFAPIQGAVAEWGLAAQASVCKFGASSVAWLARNRLGQVQIVRADGYQVTPISIPDLDYLINNYSAVEDATAGSYMLGGHPMYEISFPTAGKTWLYDARSESWQELTTGTLGRHQTQWIVNFRNKIRVSDYRDGNIYTLDADTYTDNGTLIRRSITGRHIFQGDPMSVSEMWIDMEMGVGNVNAPGNDPQLMLRTSKDGGHTWSNELWQSIGAQGVYQKRAVYRRLGRARDWVFECAMSDPVKTVFVGAFMEASQ